MVCLHFEYKYSVLNTQSVHMEGHTRMAAVGLSESIETRIERWGNDEWHYGCCCCRIITIALYTLSVGHVFRCVAIRAKLRAERFLVTTQLRCSLLKPKSVSIQMYTNIHTHTLEAVFVGCMSLPRKFILTTKLRVLLVSTLTKAQSLELFTRWLWPSKVKEMFFY